MTYKVLKSCRSKIATLAHNVCDVHGGSSLYIKTYWQSLCRVFPTGGKPKQKFAHSPPTHQIFIPSYQKSIQLNKKLKTSFLVVVTAPAVPFLF